MYRSVLVRKVTFHVNRVHNLPPPPHPLLCSGHLNGLICKTSRQTVMTMPRFLVLCLCDNKYAIHPLLICVKPEKRFCFNTLNPKDISPSSLEGNHFFFLSKYAGLLFGLDITIEDSLVKTYFLRFICLPRFPFR
ncbi:unnamed protein product [Arctogadus glacialis]